MATVFMIGAYRVVIYPNDHGPAHVHAIGPNGVARIVLGRRPADVAVVERDGIGSADLRRIVAQIIDHHAACLVSWSKYHGN